MKASLLGILTFFSFAFLSPTDIAEEIVTAFKNGDTEAIAKHFDENVAMDTKGNVHTYADTKAEKLLEIFFAENKPTNARLIKKGDMGDKVTEYIMLRLETAKKKFVINVYTKVVDDKKLIQQIQIK